MLPFPQDRVLRHAVAIRVFDANKMKSPLRGIKRLDIRDEPPPVADGSEHSRARVLNRCGWSHWPCLRAFKYRNSYSPSIDWRLGRRICGSIQAWCATK